MPYAKSLEEMGLGFICVAKQASCQYPISHLKRREFTHMGYCHFLVLVDEGAPDMISFAWVDQYSRYFIATIGYLEEGEDVLRQRWTQVHSYVNVDAYMVDLDIP